jgi:hypothetical protein
MSIHPLKIVRSIDPRLLLAVLGIFVLVIVTACTSDSDEANEQSVAAKQEPTPTPMITVEDGITTVVIHLSPLESLGQTGTAVFTARDSSETLVEVSVEPPFAEAQPIHLHSGTCGDIGPVLHALQNVVRGSSTTVIAEPLHEISATGAIVNVHESYLNASNYTSCGKLPLVQP